ncbi:hypothetical protein J0S82_007273, partial [Galemys pyrenaicus]
PLKDSDRWKLFIGGLSFETTMKSLRSHFEQWENAHRLCGYERSYSFWCHPVNDYNCEVRKSVFKQEMASGFRNLGSWCIEDILEAEVLVEEAIHCPSHKTRMVVIIPGIVVAVAITIKPDFNQVLNSYQETKLRF